MRFRPVFALLAVLALPAISSAGPIYLALGDSSAFGETDRTHNPSNGDRGYVSPFADYLGTSRYPSRPTVVNLAIDGETSKSWSTGLTDRVSPDGIYHNTNYATYAPNYPTQQERLRQVIAAAKTNGDTIGTVTVQLGANDLFAVAGQPGFLGLDPAAQAAKVQGQIGLLAQNYATILGEVRTALPNAEMYVIGYHNPYAGVPEHPLAPLSAPAVQGVNQVAQSLAGQFGARYVSFYDITSSARARADADRSRRRGEQRPHERRGVRTGRSGTGSRRLDGQHTGTGAIRDDRGGAAGRGRSSWRAADAESRWFRHRRVTRFCFLIVRERQAPARRTRRAAHSRRVGRRGAR